jgi:PAS domain S-box-containing protein
MTRRLNLLIVEDSVSDAELVVHQFKRAGFDLRWERVETAASLTSALTQQDWDVVLCDYRMPGFSGAEALAIVRGSGLDLPFIFVSGAMGEDVAVEAMRAGAQDYILKNNLARLVPAVERELREADSRRQRRRAEEDLRIAHEKLRRLTQAPAVLYTLKLEGETITPVMVSDNIERLLGIPPAEAVRFELWLESLHPDDHDRALTTLTTGLAREGYSMEYRLRHRDGTYRWVEDTCRVVRDASGRPREAVGVWTDITARKNLEAELAFQRQQLDFFFHGATAGLTLLDKDLRYLQINDTLAEMNGRPAGEHLGKTVREIVPDLAPVSEPILQKVLATGEPVLSVEMSGRMSRQLTGLRYWLASFFPTRGAEGAVVGVGVIVVDITERKRAEATLRHSQARLAEAQRIGNIGSWEWDLASGALTWSDQLYRMMDKDQADFLPTHEWFLAHLHPDDRQRVTDTLNAALAERRAFSQEFRLIPDTGVPHVILSQGEVVLDDQGNPVRIVGTGLDITTRKRLESQLLQAQKMEAIGLLAGGIAHDFRNQLTVIKGYAEMLLNDGLVAKEGVDMVQEVLHAASRSAEITGQLLAFSRQETLCPEPHDLSDLVGEIGKALARVIGEDITLSISPCAGRCVANVDAVQFHQAIMNLATNARDAMPAGGTLTIRTSLFSPGEEFQRAHPDVRMGPCAAVSVNDTGVGMDAQTRGRIFDPFFTTKEIGKGTGLGLSMVYGFVRQSGGAVEVASEPGKGSTFRLCLPLADAQAAR